MTDNQKLKNETIRNMYSNGTKIELGQIYVLIDMAENEEWPDWTFSDDECNLWSKFRRMILT